MLCQQPGGGDIEHAHGAGAEAAREHLLRRVEGHRAGSVLAGEVIELRGNTAKVSDCGLQYSSAMVNSGVIRVKDGTALTELLLSYPLRGMHRKKRT